MSEELKTHVKVFVTKTNCFRVNVTEEERREPLGYIVRTRYEVSIGGESWIMGKGRKELDKIEEKVKRLLFNLIGDYVVFVRQGERAHVNKKGIVTFDFETKRIEIGGHHVR